MVNVVNMLALVNTSVNRSEKIFSDLFTDIIQCERVYNIDHQLVFYLFLVS